MAIYTDLDPTYKNSVLKGYDVVEDLEAIKNSLRNIFLVAKGDVPGKPKFGNPLNLELFDLFDGFTVTTIESAIENAIELYEPRVRLKSINVVVSPEYNRLIVELNYYAMIYDMVYEDVLYIPFAHNTMTFVDSRREVISS